MLNTFPVRLKTATVVPVPKRTKITGFNYFTPVVLIPVIMTALMDLYMMQSTSVFIFHESIWTFSTIIPELVPLPSVRRLKKGCTGCLMVDGHAFLFLAIHVQFYTATIKKNSYISQ